MMNMNEAVGPLGDVNMGDIGAALQQIGFTGAIDPAILQQRGDRQQYGQQEQSEQQPPFFDSHGRHSGDYSAAAPRLPPAAPDFT